jgi:hypothetical protein
MMIRGGSFWIPVTMCGFLVVPIPNQAAFFRMAGIPWKMYTAHVVTR